MRQHDRAAAIVLGTNETVDHGIFPDRDVRAAVPGFDRLLARPWPIRHPGEELHHDQAGRIGHRGLHRAGNIGHNAPACSPARNQTHGMRVIWRISSRGNFMDILISILITFVVVILVLYLVNLLPIDGRAKQIVRVVVIIIGIISLLRYLAVF